MKRPTYMYVADEIAAEISMGKLSEGDQLPPQRQFAYARGIATSTASRVYEELIRRGLALGEIGRGTYVRALDVQKDATLIEPVSAPIDLEHNYSVRSSHKKEIMRVIRDVSTNEEAEKYLTPMGTIGWKGSQKIAAKFLSVREWAPKPASVLFTGNGRQAIAASISAITKPGDRIGVEAVTYPVLIGIAKKLGLVLIPIEMDNQGIMPVSLLDMIHLHGLKALYLQPTLQSPTAVTMSGERRSEIASIVTAQDIAVIEDGVYNFLGHETPLCSFASENTIYIDSLSKSLAPGVALGIIVAPPKYHADIKTSLQFGAWTTSGLLLAAGIHWMKSAEFKNIILEKRSDARIRQKIVREIFSDFEILGDSRAYHVWVPVPENKKSDIFATRMLRLGIALTPGGAFSATKGISPNFIRLSLASPTKDQLVKALRQVSRHLRS